MQRIQRFKSNVSRGVRQFLAGQGGFTLIELLVVVIILGVLAAVVVVNVARFAGRGQTEAYATEADNIQLAVDAYMTDNLLQSLAAGSTGTTGFAPETDFSLLVPDNGLGTALYPGWTRTKLASPALEYCVVATGVVGSNDGEVGQYDVATGAVLNNGPALVGGLCP